MPRRTELDPTQQDSLDALYGTDGWRALEQDFENRRADLNSELLGIWYTAKADADSLQTASVASVSLVSRMRELEERMEEYRSKFEQVEHKPLISVPKTIDQYL